MQKQTSKHILYGSNPPTSFVEESEFNINTSWLVRIKHLIRDDMAPPHYSKDTIEVLLCENVSGKINISQNHYILSKDKDYAFVIPPGLVHSTHFFPSPGKVYILQISLTYISHTINLNNIFHEMNFQINDLVFSTPKFDELIPDIKQLIEHDTSALTCYSVLLSIIDKIYQALQYQASSYSINPQPDDELKKIISWTNENYHFQTSIEDAAKVVGMSRTYFCSWFKKKTNMTYMQYLNQVRVSNAARLLLLGETSTAAAYACGFTNVSYFIQTFKRIEGCTPKEFKKSNFSYSFPR